MVLDCLENIIAACGIDMNERIQQLAIEAGMIVGEANGFDMTRLMPREIKFAELIVKECEKILIENVEVALDASGNPVSPEDFIKEHFGVE